METSIFRRVPAGASGWETVRPYGLAVLSSGVAVGVSLLMGSLLDRTPLILLYAAVFVTAWFGGSAPGLLSVLLTVILAEVFILPVDDPLVSIWLDAVPLTLYTVGALAMVALLTQLRERTRVLREKERQLTDFMENATVGLQWLAEDGTILWANRAQASLVGCVPGGYIGHRIQEFHADPGEAGDMLQRLNRWERIQNLEMRLRSRDGSEPTVLIDADALWQDGRFIHARCFVRDITERKRAAEAVGRLNEELEARVEERTRQLEALNRELEAFTYSVSHDLRSPVRAINGFCRVLEEDHAHRLNPDARRLFQSVSANARRMGELIDDLLAFSRLNVQTLRHGPVDMKAMAGAVAGEWMEAGPVQTASIQIADLPPAQGDSSLLRQVFSNLISNALKFSRPTGQPTVEVGGWRGDREAVYFVKDNGVGFDMNYAGKLFKVFQRLHTSEQFEGTGVGLAIVQRVVQRHGGRVWAESQPGRGATFFFSLPTAPGETESGGGVSI